MPNAWITHVKEFSDKKKMKYNDALKSQECKDAYQNSKPKKETKDIDVKMPATRPQGKMKKSDKLTMDAPMAVMPSPTEMMMPPMKMMPKRAPAQRVKSKKVMME